MTRLYKISIVPFMPVVTQKRPNNKKPLPPKKKGGKNSFFKKQSFFANLITTVLIFLLLMSAYSLVSGFFQPANDVPLSVVAADVAAAACD